MPAEINRDPGRKGKYTVSTPGGVKARCMTLRNAKRQARLLNVIDHGFKPTKK